MLTEKIHKAIVFAEKAHRKQKRKGSKAPYIIHPLSVALILARLGSDEDVIVSSLLHDTVEDCGVSLEEVRELFGENVALLVDEVTEKGKGWVERKESIIERMKNMSKDALLVKSADMLHNMSDLLLDIEEVGEKAFNKFAVPKEEKLRHCETVLREIERVWPENPLLEELKKKINHLNS